jgi:hypothetical protein
MSVARIYADGQVIGHVNISGLQLRQRQPVSSLYTGRQIPTCSVTNIRDTLHKNTEATRDRMELSREGHINTLKTDITFF